MLATQRTIEHTPRTQLALSVEERATDRVPCFWNALGRGDFWRNDEQVYSGPWRLPGEHDDDFAGACVLDCRGFLIADCNIFTSDDGPTEEQCEANARLIAAAPDLLAALVYVHRFGSHGEIDDDNDPNNGKSVSYFVEAAIAKATGERK